ncbi:MAG: methyl-accepting chemotaxis protein [Clostridiales bacterium]|nr:methyl-accepting chemotaxis protein [Clostridiales bacterium]
MRKNLSMLIWVAVCPTVILAVTGWLLIGENANGRLFLLGLAAAALTASVIAVSSIVGRAESSISRLRKTAAKVLFVRAETIKNDELSSLSSIISKAAAERERLISESSSADNALSEYRLMFRGIVNGLNRLADGHYDEKILFNNKDWQELGLAFEAARLRMEHLYDELQKAASEREETAEAVTGAANVLNALSAGDFSISLPDSGKYNMLNRALIAAINNLKGMTERFVKDASQALNGLAGNNLDSRITGEYSGGFGIIRDSFNNIMDGFNYFITDLRNAADDISASARKLTNKSADLSQDASIQVSSIKKLTETVMLMTERTDENKANAERAEHLASTSKENAHRGDVEMREMLSAMEGIKNASGNISKIIKVIDDIAFQTNLLALNAAVEAARAGEHGRGFSIVAEEVRSLAAKSMEAAEQTGKLIDDTVNKVNQGTSIARRTAESFEHIVEAITEVTDIIGRISVLSNEESEYFSIMSDGFSHISTLTQSGASGLTESGFIVGELSEQTDALRKISSVYTLMRASAKTINGEDVAKAINQTDSRQGQTAARTLPRRNNKSPQTTAERQAGANDTIDFNAGKVRGAAPPRSKQKAKAALTQVIKLSAVQEKRAREAKQTPVSTNSTDPQILSSTDFGKY